MSDATYATAMRYCLYAFFGSLGIALMNADWIGWYELAYLCASIMFYSAIIFVGLALTGLFTGHLIRWLR